MLYYLFNWLDEQYDFPGAGMFQYLSFRAGMAVLLSLIISIIIGKWIIKYLQKQQIGESVRDLNNGRTHHYCRIINSRFIISRS